MLRQRPFELTPEAQRRAAIADAIAALFHAAGYRAEDSLGESVRETLLAIVRDLTKQFGGDRAMLRDEVYETLYVLEEQSQGAAADASGREDPAAAGAHEAPAAREGDDNEGCHAAQGQGAADGRVAELEAEVELLRDELAQAQRNLDDACAAREEQYLAPGLATLLGRHRNGTHASVILEPMVSAMMREVRDRSPMSLSTAVAVATMPVSNQVGRMRDLYKWGPEPGEVTGIRALLLQMTYHKVLKIEERPDGNHRWSPGRRFAMGKDKQAPWVIKGRVRAWVPTKEEEEAADAKGRAEMARAAAHLQEAEQARARARAAQS